MSALFHYVISYITISLYSPRYDLMLRCWNIEPPNRPTFEEVFNELRTLLYPSSTDFTAEDEDRSAGAVDHDYINIYRMVSANEDAENDEEEKVVLCKDDEGYEKCRPYRDAGSKGAELDKVAHRGAELSRVAQRGADLNRVAHSNAANNTTAYKDGGVDRTPVKYAEIEKSPGKSAELDRSAYKSSAESDRSAHRSAGQARVTHTGAEVNRSHSKSTALTMSQLGSAV